MYQKHSPTSQKASESIEPEAGSLRARVLGCIRLNKHFGATDDEMQSGLTPMNPSTQRPRRIELERMGLIVDSGRTRPTRSGREAVVWVAREYAKAQLELL